MDLGLLGQDVGFGGAERLSVARPSDPTWKRPPGRPRTKWTDQLCRDNDNVPIATLQRQAIGRGHSRATLRSEPRLRVNDDDDDVALNGCILAALWRASQGPVARSEPSRATTGGGGGGLPQGRDDPIAEAPGSSGHVCSRHQLSNCSRCGDDLIVVVQSDARQTRLVGCKPVVNK